MHIALDFRSSHPIYLQIVEQVRAQIDSGALRPGDQLPTVRQLAADLRVNFNTVARAYRLLDEAGLISTQHGRGTYVWDGHDESADRLQQKGLQELVRDFLHQAGRLGHSPDDILQTVQTEIDDLKKIIS